MREIALELSPLFKQIRNIPPYRFIKVKREHKDNGEEAKEEEGFHLPFVIECNNYFMMDGFIHSLICHSYLYDIEM